MCPCNVTKQVKCIKLEVWHWGGRLTNTDTNALLMSNLFLWVADTDVICLSWLGENFFSSITVHVVTFRTTDPTPSLSPLEMLRRCIVDHQTLPVVHSLFPSGQFLSWPKSSGTLPYAKSPLPYPWYFTCQRTPFNTCILTQDLRLWSCMEQIPYVQFSLSHVRLIYSTCYFLFHMSFLNLPHARCPLLPVMFHLFSI